MTELPFTVELSGSVRIDTVVRGRRYVIHQAVAVLAVRDTGETNPDGSPKLDVRISPTFLVELAPDETPDPPPQSGPPTGTA